MPIDLMEFVNQGRNEGTINSICISGCAGAFHQYPDLAAAVVTQMAIMSECEQELITLVAALSQSDFGIICTMFEKIRSVSEKRKVVEKIFENNLCDRNLLALGKATVRTMIACIKMRNDFAHHIWSSLDIAPDMLALTPPKYADHPLVAPIEPMVDFDLEARTKKVDEAFKGGKLWNHKELLEEAVKAEKCKLNIRNLYRALTSKQYRTFGENRAAQDLLQDPEIKERYDSMVTKKDKHSGQHGAPDRA